MKQDALRPQFDSYEVLICHQKQSTIYVLKKILRYIQIIKNDFIITATVFIRKIKF